LGKNSLCDLAKYLLLTAECG